MTTNQSTGIDNVIVNNLFSWILNRSKKIMAFHQNKPIAIGMVGGGPDSGIGETHRIAMRIDNKCELIAGAFSRSREKSLAVAKELRIAGERIYDNYRSMAAAD